MLYKNLFKLVLKTLMLVKRVRFGGSTFQSFAAFIVKLSSNLARVTPCKTKFLAGPLRL